MYEAKVPTLIERPCPFPVAKRLYQYVQLLMPVVTCRRMLLMANHTHVCPHVPTPCAAALGLSISCSRTLYGGATWGDVLLVPLFFETAAIRILPLTKPELLFGWL